MAATAVARMGVGMAHGRIGGGGGGGSDSIEIHGETNSWLRGVRDKEQSSKYTRPSFQSAFVTDRCRFNGPFTRVHVDISVHAAPVP